MASGVIFGGALLSQILKKQWNTAGDEKVRISHVMAEGQRVNVDDPFIVKGEKLLYPGDSSFGASLDNIIECRCNSVSVANE